MPTDALMVAEREQQEFSTTVGDVDGITRSEGEDASYPCRNGYATITAECDVWATSMFQQCNHGCKFNTDKLFRGFKFRKGSVV